jgi:hypothetical protein
MKASKIWSDDADAPIGQMALLREKVEGIATPLWFIAMLLVAQLAVMLARRWVWHPASAPQVQLCTRVAVSPGPMTSRLPDPKCGAAIVGLERMNAAPLHNGTYISTSCRTSRNCQKS